MSEHAVSTDAFTPGEMATVAGVEIRIALETRDAAFAVGQRRVDPSDGDVVVFECRVHNGSDEAIRLPTRDAFDTQGRALPNLAAHHFRDGETVRPSYFRLSAAYGDALVAPDTTVSGLVASELGDDSTDPTVSITVGVADEERTLTWRLAPTDAGSEAARKTPAPTPAPGSSQTPAVDGESPTESPDTEDAVTDDSEDAVMDDSEDAVMDDSEEAPTGDDDAETTSSLRCPDCDDSVAPTHNFCGNCGASL